MKESKRNKEVQIIPLFDESGKKIGKKTIYHEKKTNLPQYGDRTAWWNMLNKTKRKKEVITSL